jgi:rhamnosyltransferase
MIAILLASYNGEKYIKEQIDSILGQMDRVPEKCVLYIHDDGSKDGTYEILSEYVRQNPDRVKILEGSPQGGSTKNFMYMLGAVEADYYMFSDQDDVWLPEKIEREYEEIRKLEGRLHSDCSGQNCANSAPAHSIPEDMKEVGSKGGTGIDPGNDYPALVFSDM